MYRLKSGGVSDLGLERKVNEDSYYLDPDNNLFIVADGMGGHAAGEVASRISVDTVVDFIKTMVKEKTVNWPFEFNEELSSVANGLINAVQSANQAVGRAVVEDPQKAGMGSTIVALLIEDEQAYIAHVGDSRAYRIREQVLPSAVRDNKIEQLTNDHSWVNEQVKYNLLSEEEAKNHRFKNVITRALGSQPEVKVDLRTEEIEKGDYLILCSDGLSSLVEAEDIKEIILNSNQDPQKACHDLVKTANNNGGTDNITVIIVYFY